MMRVLVGGIGYRNLRDHSFGVMVVERLAQRSWPAGVSIEDISYGPIAVVQRLGDDPVEARFARAVIVSAAERAGREPGTLTVYRWDGALPPADQIQTAVTEAVTGVIAMDNTLIIGRHFEALPREVLVIEAQPATDEYGESLSAALADAFEVACDMAATAAIDPSFAARVPVLPLGGGAPRLTGSFIPQVSHVRPRSH